VHEYLQIGTLTKEKEKGRLMKEKKKRKRKVDQSTRICEGKRYALRGDW
jgi:hypothetical protein